MSPKTQAKGKSVQKKDQIQSELSYSQISDSPDMQGLSEFVQVIGPEHELTTPAFDFYCKIIQEESQYRRDSDNKARETILKDQRRANNYRFLSFVLTCLVLLTGIITIAYMSIKGITDPIPYIAISVIITGSAAFTVWRLFQKNPEI